MRFLLAGLVLVWASAIVIPVGTYLQISSPLYDQYERHLVRQIQEHHPNADLGPSMFVARIFAVPAAIALCGFVGFLYSGWLLTLRYLARRKPNLESVAPVVFALGSALGVYLGLVQAWDSYRWRFTTLAVGFGISAAGLVAGVVGGVVIGLTPQGKRAAFYEPADVKSPVTE